MAAPLLLNNVTVLAKVETTYGADPVPVVGTDAVLTAVPTVVPDMEMLERNTISASLSPEPIIPGRKIQTASFQMEFKSQVQAYAGTSTTPLEQDPIYQAMGLSPTYTLATDVTYKPISSSFKSSTFYFYFQDVLYKVTGGFASGTFRLEAGGLATCDVEVTGLYNAPSDSTPGAPTIDNDVAVQVESIGLTINAVTTLVCRSVEFALNNNIVERRDVNSVEGMKGLRIAGRAPTATVVIEEELVATFNPWTLMDAGTTFAMTFTHGAVAGKKITGTFPAAQITGITPGDDNGIRTLELAMRLNKGTDAGNDEVSLKFF